MIHKQNKLQYLLDLLRIVLHVFYQSIVSGRNNWKEVNYYFISNGVMTGNGVMTSNGASVNEIERAMYRT